MYGKMIAAAAALILTIALTGCGNTEKPAQNTDTPDVKSAVETDSTDDTPAEDTSSETPETTEETVSSEAIPETESTASEAEQELISEPEEETDIPDDNNNNGISFEDIDTAADRLSTSDIDANDAVLRELFGIDFAPEPDEVIENGDLDIVIRKYAFDEPIYIKNSDLPVVRVSTTMTKIAGQTDNVSLRIHFDCSDKDHPGEFATEEYDKLAEMFREMFNMTDDTPVGGLFESDSGHNITLEHTPDDPTTLRASFMVG